MFRILKGLMIKRLVQQVIVKEVKIEYYGGREEKIEKEVLYNGLYLMINTTEWGLSLTEIMTQLEFEGPIGERKNKKIVYLFTCDQVDD